MKNMRTNTKTLAILFGIMSAFIVGCQRNLSDEVEFAKYPNTPGVFIDGFVGGLQYFPFAGSKLNAFTVDTETRYAGTASMRIDVPNVGDASGAYAGAIFPDAGGRDLSDFDALTFWAKSTQAGTINEIGFGNDFGENKYMVTLANMRINTTWTKYTIPIPDPSLLTFEKGMFWYAEGPESGNGYTFWIDELKFEKLGTVAQPRPAIFNGEDKVESSFTGSTTTITGLTQTFNLASGLNQTVLVAPSYYKFTSSNNSVAQVSEKGVVTLVGPGTAKITAILDGVKARGSLSITSSGNITLPIAPVKPAANVISLFSDVYTNVPVDFFNGFYGGSTTQTADIVFNNDNLKYYSKLNYVGIEFNNPTVDASTMQFLHLDIWTNEPTSANFEIKIRDRGANGVLNTDVNTGAPTVDDKEITYVLQSSAIKKGEWVSVDIPLTGSIATQKNNLAQIVFVGNINFLLDNLYFYK
ncbi:MAG: Ig-like domain-containing protein [Flammeovirgaceae bacterium]|jgi:hypothetical protein|nr:Ig-like domain-containing protein [Flammeovirgaceae bacterium]